MKGLNVKAITSTAIPVTVGAVGAKFLKNIAGKMVQNEKLRAAMPLILGLLLAGSKKTEKFGMGLIAVGGADLVGSLIPALNGIEDMDLSGVFGDDDLGDTLNDGYDVGGTSYDVGATLNGFGGDDDMNGYEDY